VRAQAEDGLLVPGKNPCGLYLYAEDVDALTATVAPDVLGNGPEDKPWGMYEFSWGHRSGLDRAINGNFIKLRWSRLGDLRTPWVSMMPWTASKLSSIGGGFACFVEVLVR
jgi:hypothetical protein